jgi:hypothetical protein
MYVPIFIIVHDRLTVLKKAVKSFETQIKTPIKIIFHDVASTYKPCLDYLESTKYDVYRSKINSHLTVMNTVNKYMNEHPECEYYVITDPDIELDNVNGDILDFYIFLSKMNPGKVIGPSLRIDDLPDNYPHKQKVIKHESQYWDKSPTIIDYNNNKYKIQYQLIDTTFQLVPKTNLSRKFPRQGIRCYAPYGARHLDWYLNTANLSEDQIYYSKNSSKHISNWSTDLHESFGIINNIYYKLLIFIIYCIILYLIYIHKTIN